MRSTSLAPPTGGPRFPHLPALDGLRGVAVALVVVYHLAPSALPGGFLGVDVFFVLSGFLITSLLLVEATSTGRIDLRTFYVRRLRRLAPALLLVVLALSLYAWWSATVGELDRLRQHSLWTLGYLVNWKFILDGTTYTDLVAGQSPLRHAWSLAIEEQFYVVVPALVLLAGMAVRWRPSTLRRVVLVGAVAGTVASAVLMAALWGDGSDPSRGYFGTDTRAHSLLVGVALGAACLGRPPQHGVPARVAGVAGAVGTLVLGAALVLGRETSSWLQHGGFLLVALAVAGIVSAVERSGWLRWILSARPLVGLGVISYGVYLWHWPVIVLVDEARSGLDGPVLAVAQIALTLGLAGASYAVVERPVRGGALGRILRRAAPLAVGGAVAALVLIVVVATTVPAPPPAADARPFPPPAAASADARGVLIFGDSVAHTLAGGTVGSFPDFEPWAPEQSPFDPSRVRLWSEARPACSFLPGGLLVEGATSPADLSGFCGEWATELDESLVEHPSAIVLVALANDGADRDLGGERVPLGSAPHDALLVDFLDEVRGIATRHGARIGLVALPPVSDRGPSAGDQGGRRQRLLRTFYEAYARRHPGVAVIDLFEELCPEGDCGRPSDGFDPAWRYDGLHYTADGSRWVADWLTEELDSAFP